MEYHLILLPAYLPPGQNLAEIGVLRQGVRHGIVDETHIGIALLLRGIELRAGRFKTCVGFGGKRRNQRHNEKVKAPCRFAGPVQLRQNLPPRYRDVLGYRIYSFECLDSQNSPIKHTPYVKISHKYNTKYINFDIFVVGDDWTGKYDYLKEQGIQVVYFPYGEGISCSNLKKKMSPTAIKIMLTMTVRTIDIPFMMYLYSEVFEKASFSLERYGIERFFVKNPSNTHKTYIAATLHPSYFATLLQNDKNF